MTERQALPGAGKAIGIIGCGSIGGRYARCLAGLGASVVVYDADPARVPALGDAMAAEGLARPVSAASLAAILERPLDGVIVSTPPSAHAEVAEAVLAGGHRLLCEKPLAHSLTSATRIVEAARRHPGWAHGVCNMRYHPAIQVVKAHLSRIGTPLVARAHFGHRLAQMRPKGIHVFTASYAEGGGVVLDCVHELDYLTWLFGPLEPCIHTCGQIGPERLAAEDWASATLIAQTGVRVELSLDFLARYKRRGCEITGSEGSLVWQSLGRRPERALVTLETTDAQEILWQSDSVDANIEYVDMLTAFLDAPDNLQTLETAFQVLALALTLRQPAT